MRRWTLARRVVVLVGVIAVGVFASMVVLVVVTTRSEAAVDDLLSRIAPARRASGDLFTALVEQQNAARGYALTGSPERRVAYQGALEHERRLVADLRRLLPVSAPELGSELDVLVAEADQWRRDGVDPLLDMVAVGGPRAAAPQAYQREQQLSLPVLTAADSLVDAFEHRRYTAIEELGAFRRAELIALVGGGLLAVLAGVTAVVLLRRWVTNPIERLAADARRVADGDHEHQVGIPTGPPELTAVAGDVERMRSRIVSELAALATHQRELRETRDRLQSQAVDLMRSNRDLEQFAYVASHDLQEPLRKVAGFCQLLQRRYAGQLDERAEQYIAFAVDGAQRMQQLISELLTFSQVGRAQAPLVDVDLRELTESVVAELDGDVAKLDGRIEVGELPTVRADPGLLRQLMTNLIGNALKFHRQGVPPVVRVDAAPDPPFGWRISVADNGIGIEPEFADRIFVLFQRLHGRDRYGGTGIGLALAKRIVEHHGGRIWLDTARRDGTTIRFTLPTASQESTG